MSGGSLEQQGTVELQCEMDGRRQAPVGHVALLGEQVLQVVY